MSDIPDGSDPLDLALRTVARDVDAIRAEARGDPPLTIFHYTNSAGLRGIIQGKRIFATHYRYLNDASEIDYGTFVLGTAIEKLMAETKDRETLLFLELLRNNANLFDKAFDCYIACFCTGNDLLNQWRHYSGTEGYALGFSTLELARDRGGSTAPEHDFFLREVIYDPRQQVNLLEAMLRRTIAAMHAALGELQSDQRNTVIARCCHFAQLQLPQYLPTFKHSAFEAEREWRLCHLAVPDQCHHVRFRDGQFGLTPYVELAPRFQCQEQLPLESITHAPTNNASNVRFALSTLLRSQGYTGVKLAGSILPMRTC